MGVVLNVITADKIIDYVSGRLAPEEAREIEAAAAEDDRAARAIDAARNAALRTVPANSAD